jgi:hypothetical protein
MRVGSGSYSEDAFRNHEATCFIQSQRRSCPVLGILQPGLRKHGSACSFPPPHCRRLGTRLRHPMAAIHAKWLPVFTARPS